MNSEIYTRILEQALLPFIKNKYDCDDFEFLQDNAPIHKSKLSMNWFKENSIKLVSFPTKSPDLNPIEKIWNGLKNMIEKESAETQEELKNSIKKNWKKISTKKIRAQIKHLDKIIPKILENGGEFNI
ncbi:transposable element-related [Anaeramoeba flamelloides]|uniref:Transposable element-related n=1 Tax=Anaeramoeba flamelloides TaxID=1746091 RepID=A0AAV7YYT7_9EUKA|nr:transposable element-related [Anaeramoeba flamelloides]